MGDIPQMQGLDLTIASSQAPYFENASNRANMCYEACLPKLNQAPVWSFMPGIATGHIMWNTKPNRLNGILRLILSELDRILHNQRLYGAPLQT